MVTFDQARANPTLRQAFLDGLDLGDMRRRCKVTYSNKNKYAHSLAALTGSRIPLRGMIDDTPLIAVRDLMFTETMITNEEDVLNLLYDHERTHVAQFEQGLVNSVYHSVDTFSAAGMLHGRCLSDARKFLVIKTAIHLYSRIIETPAYEQQLNGRWCPSAASRKNAEEALRSYALTERYANEVCGENMTALILDDPVCAYAKLITGDNILEIHTRI